MNQTDLFNVTKHEDHAETYACNNPFYPFTYPQRLALHIMAIPVTVFTIVYNFAVVAIFVTTTNFLRQPHQLYFFNLAICDLIIGLVALPSRLVQDLYGCWPLPDAFCRMYKILDWVVSSEIAGNIILIAFLRYDVICEGAARREESFARVATKILQTWIINAIIFGPVQFLDMWTGLRLAKKGQCSNEFFQVPILANFLVVLGLFPPVIVVLLNILASCRKKRITQSVVVVSLSACLELHKALQELREERVRKQMRTMLLLTLSFLITTCPISLTTIMSFADSTLIDIPVSLLLLYFLYFNSFFNAVIYHNPQDILSLSRPLIRARFSA
ncbi:hypothetical protein RvY_10158 [Ramazzottius varieornatus]|uniref:G-protein coupled receptors family 1 profile domain-containing protein n=1 Tax=Ramazzottius varieornatus TaxID=947166 RepID=A0A1D1VBU9_RAMVA|nr:hypothetical protein RvY_10158 [Ramazzottius varieornatus]